MKSFFAGIVGIAIGSTISMLLASTGTTLQTPVPCICHCGEAIARAIVEENNAISRTAPPQSNFGRDSSFPHKEDSRAATVACPVPVPCPPPNVITKVREIVKEPTEGERCSVPLTPPAPVNLPVAEAALTRYHEGRWGGKGMGRAAQLCYVNNNQQLIDEDGRVSYVWDHDSDEWEASISKGQKQLFDQSQKECLAASVRVNAKSTVHDKFRKVSVNGKVISIDDIMWGYETIFQSQELFSAVSFLGVSMQQTPNDAFVIADMLWRLRPDLLIELGTSGGGSAHFLMHVMEQYNPKAQILTMDPALPGAGSAKSEPLVAWNSAAVRRFCPHCTAANESAVWKRGNIHFVRKIPTSPEAVAIAESYAARAKTVMVIEDSTHEYGTVLANAKAYARFVTPGSYMLVQDTRCGRWKPAHAVETFLQEPEGLDFSVDPRWEYMVFSQHSGGFLRKSGEAEQGPSW